MGLRLGWSRWIASQAARRRWAAVGAEIAEELPKRNIGGGRASNQATGSMAAELNISKPGLIPKRFRLLVNVSYDSSRLLEWLRLVGARSRVSRKSERVFVSWRILNLPAMLLSFSLSPSLPLHSLFVLVPLSTRPAPAAREVVCSLWGSASSRPSSPEDSFAALQVVAAANCSPVPRSRETREGRRCPPAVGGRPTLRPERIVHVARATLSSARSFLRHQRGLISRAWAGPLWSWLSPLLPRGSVLKGLSG